MAKKSRKQIQPHIIDSNVKFLTRDEPDYRNLQHIINETIKWIDKQKIWTKSEIAKYKSPEKVQHIFELGICITRKAWHSIKNTLERSIHELNVKFAQYDNPMGYRLWNEIVIESITENVMKVELRVIPKKCSSEIYVVNGLEDLENSDKKNFSGL
jgi:hypothetical protein